MKTILTLSVLFLSLGFNQSVRANESAHAATEPATCSAETQENCSKDPKAEKPAAHEAAAEEGHGTHTAAKDWSHKRQEQVSAIFPHKEKIAGKDIRPEKPVLMTPKAFAKVSGNSVTLTWEAAKGAVNYHVQVSKDAGFNNRSMYVAEDKWVKTTSFEVKDLEPGVKYFWRVEAVNMEQESQFTKSPFAFSSFETTAK